MAGLVIIAASYYASVAVIFCVLFANYAKIIFYIKEFITWTEGV